MSIEKFIVWLETIDPMLRTDRDINAVKRLIDLFIDTDMSAELTALRAREKVLVEALEAAVNYATMMPTDSYHEDCECTIACKFYNRVSAALADKGEELKNING